MIIFRQPPISTGNYGPWVIDGRGADNKPFENSSYSILIIRMFELGAIVQNVRPPSHRIPGPVRVNAEDDETETPGDRRLGLSERITREKGW